MSILTLASLLLAGVAAGVLTTVAGLGGGMLLIAGLSLVWPPAVVVATTAPALLVGCASRALLLRDAIAWPTLLRFAGTAAPTAAGASLVAATLPPALGQGLVAAFILAGVAHELGAGRAAQAPHAEHPGRLAALAGAIAGLASGLSGGGGFVATPLLTRAGLAPLEGVATGAAAMAIVHGAKIVGFGLADAPTQASLPAVAALTAGLLAGNALGAPLLRRLSRETFRRLTLATLGLTGAWLLGTLPG
ncbi:MAG: sulfite exporter TauE/SafE family protein [Candidatus Sericytochromatia bacterium]|nr:sulfite exporter TauE/SafE family protein [Candidatus Sericytochromatia bacterium]